MCAEKKPKSICINKAHGKDNSNCTWRWAARIIGDNPVNGFTCYCGQFSEDWPNCGYGPKGRLGVIVEGVGIKIKNMSLAIYTRSVAGPIYLKNNLTKPRKVWEGIKELRDFKYFARANRCIWYPSSKKLRMDGMKVSKMIKRFRQCSQVVLNLGNLYSSTSMPGKEMDRWCFSFSCYLMVRWSAQVSVSVVMVAQPLTRSPQSYSKWVLECFLQRHHSCRESGEAVKMAYHWAPQ